VCYVVKEDESDKKARRPQDRKQAEDFSLFATDQKETTRKMDKLRMDDGTTKLILYKCPTAKMVYKFIYIYVDDPI
jgi:hypothetical protein